MVLILTSPKSSVVFQIHLQHGTLQTDSLVDHANPTLIDQFLDVCEPPWGHMKNAVATGEQLQHTDAPLINNREVDTHDVSEVGDNTQTIGSGAVDLVDTCLS